jgi:mono/diheme cytochrome c family protein
MQNTIRFFAVSLLVAVMALSMAACSSDDGSDGGDSGTATRAGKVAALTGDQTAGKTTYEAQCGGCHKADGTGNNGPNIISGTKAALSVTAVATAIIDGKGSMPAFNTLSDQEIANTVAYVQGQLAGK